jgi:hypothetical protein
MTDDENVEFLVTIRGMVKTTDRNFCIETYLKELDKYLRNDYLMHYICPKTQAVGTWAFTTHYSLNKTIINGVEVKNMKECCKDDEIKIENKWENIP